MNLADKRIVIIGGTSGLGLAGALALKARGARVAALGLGADACEAAARALGADGVVLEGDATEEGAPERVIEACRGAWGGCDGLYHVAGGSGRAHGDGPLHELTLDGWRKTLDLNLTSVMLSNRAAARTFLAQGGGGAIVNMGSVLASAPSPKHFSTHAYAAAKAAIGGFSRALAAYYAKDGVRVNVVSPGLVDTPMAQRAVHNADIMRFIKTKQPLDGGRIGEPADLNGAVCLLLSDEGRFITGQEIRVDGGWSVSEGQY